MHHRPECAHPAAACCQAPVADATFFLPRPVPASLAWVAWGRGCLVTVRGVKDRFASGRDG